MEQQTKQQECTAGITFAVSGVSRATEVLTEKPYAEVLGAALGQYSAVALEAYSRNTKPLVPFTEEPVHPFIYACNLAYDNIAR